ncbi:MAG TPA: hypothetical protein V6D17_10505 [Candidatus Obscuribacterales bacterium]
MASILISPSKPSYTATEEADEVSSLEWELRKLSSQLEWIVSYKQDIEDRMTLCEQQIQARKSQKKTWWQTVKDLLKEHGSREPVQFN